MPCRRFPLRLSYPQSCSSSCLSWFRAMIQSFRALPSRFHATILSFRALQYASCGPLHLWSATRLAGEPSPAAWRVPLAAWRVPWAAWRAPLAAWRVPLAAWRVSWPTCCRLPPLRRQTPEPPPCRSIGWRGRAGALGIGMRRWGLIASCSRAVRASRRAGCRHRRSPLRRAYGPRRWSFP